MIEPRLTISKHYGIRLKVFDFLLHLTFQLDDKTKQSSDVSIVDLIDFVYELEFCDSRHDKSLECLKSIIKRLTAAPSPDKLEVERLTRNWIESKNDLEDCQRPIKLY